MKCKKCNNEYVNHNRVYDFHDIHECNSCHFTWYTRIEECCRAPFEIVTILRYNHDIYSLYYQCLRCGGANKRKHLKSKDYQDQIRAEFNDLAFESWKMNRKDEAMHIYEGLKHSNYRLTPYYKYREYLNSHGWKEKRKEVMLRDNYLCQNCKLEKAEDVHHLTYENLFDEPLADLQALCRTCHLNIHRKNDKDI